MLQEPETSIFESNSSDQKAPTEVSFERARVTRKAREGVFLLRSSVFWSNAYEIEEDMAAALLAMQPSEVTVISPTEQKTIMEDNPQDITISANPSGLTGTGKTSAKGKGKGKAKLTPKERKDRNVSRWLKQGLDFSILRKKTPSSLE